MIGVSEAAKLAACTARHIQQLVAEGFIPKSGHGTYRVRDVAAGRIASLKDEERRGSRSAAKGRLSDVRTAEIEQRMAERNRAMVQQANDHTLAVVDEFAGSLLSDLLGLPARVTKDLELRRKLDDGIRDAFTAAAKRARDASTS